MEKNFDSFFVFEEEWKLDDDAPNCFTFLSPFDWKQKLIGALVVYQRPRPVMSGMLRIDKEVFF